MTSVMIISQMLPDTFAANMHLAPHGLMQNRWLLPGRWWMVAIYILNLFFAASV